MEPFPLDKTRYGQVGLIRSFFPNRTGFGTGTHVNPGGILTAAHNIYDPEYGGWADRFEVVFPGGAVATAPKANGRVIPEWVSTGLPDPLSLYDVGVILPERPVAADMADFLPSVNTDLWGHNVNVVGYPYNWKFEFAGGESVPVQSPFPPSTGSPTRSSPCRE